MIRNRNYDGVADIAMEQTGPHELEAQILAARFSFYRNQMNLVSPFWVLSFL